MMEHFVVVGLLHEQMSCFVFVSHALFVLFIFLHSTFARAHDLNRHSGVTFLRRESL